MDEINELLKKLPKWIHLTKEPFSCPHCGKAYNLDEKPKVLTCYDHVLLNEDHWIVRFAADGEYVYKDFTDKDLRIALKKAIDYIEKNKKELRPYYASNS